MVGNSTFVSILLTSIIIYPVKLPMQLLWPINITYPLMSRQYAIVMLIYKADKPTKLPKNNLLRCFLMGLELSRNIPAVIATWVNLPKSN